MSPIYWWRYCLRSALPLNAASSRLEHEGALLRIGEGFACLHPWPELGDLELATQLRLLASGGTSPLIAGAIRCAAADGAAREAGVSLFQTPIPKSHWLAGATDEPDQVRADGFSSVKLKIGGDLVQDRERVKDWAEAGFRLRLDANERPSFVAFQAWWEALGEFRERVELVEDAIAWEAETWEELRGLGVPLAVDRELESRWRPRDIAVVKPAVSDWLPPSDARILLTSYMDHALGQLWAAAEATRLESEGRALLGTGLLTHYCFESDPFFEQLRLDGARLLPPGGTGLGYDELLDSLPWKRLS